MTKIRLVLSGSGTRFPVFAGAIKRLEEEGCVIEAVIGTSGGSVIAAGLASGYNANKLIAICKEVMPRLAGLIDLSLIGFLKNWGFIAGKKIQAELGKYFIKKMGDAKIPLFITASNFDTEKLQIFSSVEHPNLDTMRASRASISIPIVFEPVNIDGDLYVDGGVKKNFAIDFFGNNANTIGLYFLDKPGRKPRPNGFTAIVEFVGRIVDMLINARTEDDIEDAPSAIKIALTSSVSGLDFSLQSSEVNKMIKEGYDCVDAWIKANPGKI